MRSDGGPDQGLNSPARPTAPPPGGLGSTRPDHNSRSGSQCKVNKAKPPGTDRDTPSDLVNENPADGADGVSW